MRHFLAILLISKAVSGFSQNNPEVSITTSKHRVIDSLESKLKTVSQEERFEVLQALFRECRQVDQNKAQLYINEALVQAKIDGDSLEMVKAFNGIALLLKINGKLNEAIELFTDALEVSQRNNFSNQIKYMLNNLAVSYSSMSAYDKALYYHFESLKLRKQEGNAVDISVALNNIGTVYEQLKDYKNALFFFQQSYDTKINNGVQYDIVRTLINIGLIHNRLNEFVLAENKLNDARTNCIKKECSTDLLVAINNTFGETLFNQRKYQESQNYFEESLRLINLNTSAIYSSYEGKPEYLALTLYWLGVVHCSQNQNESGMDYLTTSIKISEEFGIHDTMMNNYILISKILASKNDFKRAYEYQKKYIQLNSELLSGEVINRITELRIDFDQRENLSKIAAQERIVSLQNKFNISIGTIAILAFVISLIVFRLYLQKRRITKMLDIRVSERTKELERNRDELMHAHDEKVVVLRTISSNLTSSLATLKGLSIIAAHDLPQNQLIYFKEVESTTEQMVNYIKLFTKNMIDQNGNTLG